MTYNTGPWLSQTEEVGAVNPEATRASQSEIELNIITLMKGGSIAGLLY